MTASGTVDSLGTLGPPSEAIPVVILPGTMGSRLSFDGNQWAHGIALNGKRAWDPDDHGLCLEALVGGWVKMQYKLRVSLERGAKHDRFDAARDLVYGFHEISAAFYGRMAGELATTLAERLGRPVAVYARGYDFRHSNIRSANILRPRLDAIAAYHGQKMIVVAHSMGGLVGRYYSHRLGGQKKIRAMFLVGSPTLGAPDSFMMLRGHYPFSSEKKDRYLLQGLAPELPSVYDLLPHNRLRVSKSTAWLDFEPANTGYDPATGWRDPKLAFDNLKRAWIYPDPYAGVVPYSQIDSIHPFAASAAEQIATRRRHLATAHDFHRRMSRRRRHHAHVYVHPKTHLFYESGLPTVVAATVTGDRGSRWTTMDTLQQGDGSVPRNSANPTRRDLFTIRYKNGKRKTRRVTPVPHRVSGEHGELMNETNVINSVLEEIQKVVSR